MTHPKFTTGEALFAHLTEALHLTDHTITFHTVELGDDFEIGSGMIPDWETLNDDVAFDYVADRHWREEFLYVFACTTYQLGSGESEDATGDELDALDRARKESPDAFDSMLAQYADVLFNLTDSNVANPAYDEDALDEE